MPLGRVPRAMGDSMTDGKVLTRVACLATPERLLRWSLAVVYLWFGTLKLVGMSPVLQLVRLAYEPLATLPLYLGLALLEVGLGTAFALGLWRRVTAATAILHLLGTFSLVLSSPRTVFLPRFPFLTMEGEFVVKNLVLLAAAVSLWLASSKPAPSPGPRPRLEVLAGVLVAAGLLGFAGARVHTSLRAAACRSAADTSASVALPTEAIRALVGEGEGQSISVQGRVVDRCRLLGCWLKVKDRTGELFVDLARGGLSARGLALGSVVRVTGHLGKTREGQVGFVATAMETIAEEGRP